MIKLSLNRNDIGFTIISRFETTYRCFLSNKIFLIFNDNYLQAIPEGIINKVKERNNGENFNDISELLEYTDIPDLMEITLFKNSYDKFLDNVQLSKENFKEHFDNLYELRCKIDHARGTLTSFELDMLIEITRNLFSQLIEERTEFLDFLKVLEESPEKVEIIKPIFCSFNSCSSDKYDNIFHNIPIPDYEYEGGFVGRNQDKKIIKKLLLDARRNVITIAGAGGVGKTALAFKVVDELIGEKNHNFDGVIWLSAKETKLSYLGIEDIEPDIKNHEELLDTIYEVMGFGQLEGDLNKKQETVNIIFDACRQLLIVIDNLETIHDEHIKNFILDFHPNVKILITSRKGLGQVEIRHELKELKENEAVQLFKSVSKDKNLISLLKIEEQVIKKYVKKVSYYPLAIKWMLGQIAKGKDIDKVVDSIDSSSSDISLFCFDQIYQSLTNEAKKILSALCYFHEPQSAGILNYAANLDQIQFEDGIEELIIVSLVIPEQRKTEKDNITSLYTLLPLTRGYVRQQLDLNPNLKRELEEKLNSIHLNLEEAERAKSQYRYSLHNLGAVTDEEKIAAVIVQTSFQQYQSGRYEYAVLGYKRAIEIAPNFSSVYRNWAVMESSEGHFNDADSLMNKAVKINPNDVQLWLTWGNIKMKNDRVKEALPHYKKAYDLCSSDYVVLNSLGQAKCRLGNHNEAHELFIQALKQESTGSSIKHEIINRTSIADNLKRWAEVLIRDKNYLEAEHKLLDAFENIQVAIKHDSHDIKSQKIYKYININLGHFYKNKNPLKSIEYFSNCIVAKPIKYIDVHNTLHSSIQIAKIYINLKENEKAKEILSHTILYMKEPLNRDSKLKQIVFDLWTEICRDKLLGRIIKEFPDKGYILLENVIGYNENDTYLGHFNEFIPSLREFTGSLKNKFVEFNPEITINKKQAKRIILLQPKNLHKTILGNKS